MRPLNYHHLYYFWRVAREGTITAACEKLGVAQPTISAQLRTLERSLGKKLFQQKGRTLELTDVGRVAYGYADDIFALGGELSDILDGRLTGSRTRLRVGVADGLPKRVASRLLAPAVDRQDLHLICFEGKSAELLVKLSLHELDLVLSDSPNGSEARIRAYNHQLGECGVVVLGPRGVASRYRSNFPAALDAAPFLLPTENIPLRRQIDAWFASHGIRPRVAAEFEDSALLETFVRRSEALFVAPAVVEREIIELHAAERVGLVEEVRVRFYAVSLERRVRHSGVALILEAAHRDLFAA